MREILFQAKTWPNILLKKPEPGYWVEGYYCSKGGTHFISVVLKYASGKPYFSDVMVQQETVRQFTGFYDKHKKKIFDGDILKCIYEDVGEVTARYEKGDLG